MNCLREHELLNRKLIRKRLLLHLTMQFIESYAFNIYVRPGVNNIILGTAMTLLWNAFRASTEAIEILRS